MRNKLKTHPVNNGEKLKMRFIFATLLDMIGGSPNVVENNEIDEQVKRIQLSETKRAVSNLEKRILQTYKVQKAPKIKKAVIKGNIDNVKNKPSQTKQEQDKEMEGR